MSLYVDELRSSKLYCAFPRKGCIDSETIATNEMEKEDVSSKMFEIIESSQVFDIGNVASYFYMGSPQEKWCQSDFPRPMPPFQSMWFEWKLPMFKKTISGAIEQLEIGDWFSRVGCLVQCLSADAFVSQIGRSTSEKLFDHISNRMVQLTPVPGFRGGGPAIVFPTVVIGIGEEYSIECVVHGKDTRLGSGFLFRRVHGTSDEHFISYPKWLNNICDIAEEVILPVVLALSMLNCRNVASRTVNTSPRLIKKHTRRGHAITKSHHVIEIQPMIDAVHAATGRTGYERSAAKIVRGHFKDYSKRGLFGKYKGLYWWDEQKSDETAEYRMKSSSGPLDPKWDEQRSLVGANKPETHSTATVSKP